MRTIGRKSRKKKKGTDGISVLLSSGVFVRRIKVSKIYGGWFFFAFLYCELFENNEKYNELTLKLRFGLMADLELTLFSI